MQVDFCHVRFLVLSDALPSPTNKPSCLWGEWDTFLPPLLQKSLLRTPQQLPKGPGWWLVSLAPWPGAKSSCREYSLGHQHQRTLSCSEECHSHHQAWRETLGPSTRDNSPPHSLFGSCVLIWENSEGSHSSNISPAQHAYHLWGFQTPDHARTWCPEKNRLRNPLRRNVQSTRGNGGGLQGQELEQGQPKAQAN